MKVYVITQGSYSDYHICAVTLDNKEAERLKKIYNDPGDIAYVEVYDTDEHQPLLCGRLPYKVCFYKNRNGTTGIRATREIDNLTNFIPCVRIGGTCDVVKLYAADADAAVKIAAEKRAQAMAEKEGIT